jgi:hypothetical protein
MEEDASEPPTHPLLGGLAMKKAPPSPPLWKLFIITIPNFAFKEVLFF